MQSGRRLARGYLCAILLWLVIALAGCGAGNTGSTELAFIRGSTLLTMQPSGTNTFQVTTGGVSGFAWSPDHHQFVVRYAAVSVLPTIANPLLATYPDMPAGMGVVSIDGGNIIPITPPTNFLTRSDAWWDASGNRLFYREQLATTPTISSQWILSQSDQPNGIARKVVAQSESIPTSAPDGTQIATMLADGALVLGAPLATPHIVQQGGLVTLPSGMPARPLWQPGHTAILYATASNDAHTTTLALTDLAGHTRQLTSASDLLQYSWSPDGKSVLMLTTTGFAIVSVDGKSISRWEEHDPAALAWWSPDSRTLITADRAGLALIDAATGKVAPVVVITTASNPAPLPMPTHPITGSPWSVDGGQFAFVATGGLWLNGKDTTLGTPLATQHTAGSGLYVVTRSALGVAPHLVDWGEHTAFSWSTPDPNTQFVTS